MNSIFRDENKNGLNPVEEKNPVYRAIKKIGQGSFGKAYLVESEHDHKRYIMKVFVLFKQIDTHRQRNSFLSFLVKNTKESDPAYLGKT